MDCDYYFNFTLAAELTEKVQVEQVGGERNFKKFYAPHSGGPSPELGAQTLTLLYTTFDRKGNSSNTPSIECSTLATK